jgi:hypothetical protein
MLKKLGILVFSLVAALTLAACTESANEVQGYYVAVDINPSIEFVVDEDDVVESFIFLNEDAEILCVDLDFTGMNIDDAIELFVQTATEAGYIDPEGEDNAVLITVLGEDGQEEQCATIRERIRNSLNKHFAKNYINAVVLTEDFTQEDLVAQAEVLGVTPGKLKLALAAQIGDETLVLEELLEMPVKDILALVREYHQDEFLEYKEQRMEQLREQKQARIQEHKEEFQNYVNQHPELTEDQIEALAEYARQQYRTETRQNWQERVEEWKQAQEEKRNQENQETTEETDEA